jgi:tetratricopeptide (TPR) repeat protein
MLATKNRAGSHVVLGVALAMILLGCTPAGPRALFDGKRLLDEGKYDLAVARLKSATTLLHTNAQVWNYYGLACHRASQLTNAVSAYQKALDLDRDLLEARLNLGCAWLDLGKPELAKAEFTSFTLRRGNAAEGWLKLGTAQLRTREPAAAEKSFREALRLATNNVEALNGLGLVQLQRNRPREAAQYFATALKHQPGYRPALLNLAIVSQQSFNDRGVALEKYREYLALKPRAADWEAVSALAQSLEPAPTRATPTNQVVNAPPAAATNVVRLVTNSVTQPSPPKTNAPLPVKKAEIPPPARTNPAPATKPVAAPAPAQTAAVEVVRSPEPALRAAPESPPAPIAAKRESVAVQPASSPTRSNDSPTVERKNSVSRENPARLTSPEAKSSSSSPNADEATKVLSPALPNLAQSTAAPFPIPTSSVAGRGQRYSYLSPAKPLAGNRREAERAFAQGQQAYRTQRLPEAAQAFRQATQADPGYFEAHYNLGLVTYEARGFRQSLAAWENALAVQPDSVDARYNFALALKAANYQVDAANELKRILAANANETRAHLVLGNLFAEQFNDPAQARMHYLKVLEQDPRNPQATAIRYWLVAHPP